MKDRTSKAILVIEAVTVVCLIIWITIGIIR